MYILSDCVTKFHDNFPNSNKSLSELIYRYVLTAFTSQYFSHYNISVFYEECCYSSEVFGMYILSPVRVMKLTDETNPV